MGEKLQRWREEKESYPGTGYMEYEVHSATEEAGVEGHWKWKMELLFDQSTLGSHPEEMELVH